MRQNVIVTEAFGRESCWPLASQEVGWEERRGGWRRKRANEGGRERKGALQSPNDLSPSRFRLLASIPT